MNKKLIKRIVTIAVCFIVFTNSLIPAKASSVALIGVTDDGHDHTTYYNKINSYLNTMGYVNTKISTFTDPNKTTVMNALDTREIIVTRSHGNAFQDSNGNYNGNYISLKSDSIYNSDIEALAAKSLSNAKLIMYIGCLTAAGGIWTGKERNLVVASEGKGAATALGFSKEINCNGANTWVKYCFKHFAAGENIDRATNKAVADTKDEHYILEFLGQLNIDSMLYRGVWDYKFVN